MSRFAAFIALPLISYLLAAVTLERSRIGDYWYLALAGAIAAGCGWIYAVRDRKEFADPVVQRNMMMLSYGLAWMTRIVALYYFRPELYAAPRSLLLPFLFYAAVFWAGGALFMMVKAQYQINRVRFKKSDAIGETFAWAVMVALFGFGACCTCSIFQPYRWWGCC
jgi:hypothetical protein